jgi:hypothetical protein
LINITEASPADISAFGDPFVIVFREADPPPVDGAKEDFIIFFTFPAMP